MNAQRTNKDDKLSNTQKSALAIMATMAFNVAKSRFAVEDDVKEDDYRREGQFKATGIESLTGMKQKHFLLVRGYWHMIIGNAELAFDDFMRAGEDNEERRQKFFRLSGQLARLAEGIAAKKGAEGTPINTVQAAVESWLYSEDISGDKFNGKKIHALNGKELATLGFTIYNRASDMLGVGDASQRNKKQRNGFYKRGLPRSEKPRMVPDDGGESLVAKARARMNRAA